MALVLQNLRRTDINKRCCITIRFINWLKRELVKKTVSKTSDAQVSLYLTPLGKQAYEGHKKLHEQLSDEIFVALREMPESAYNDLFMMLKKFEQFLDKQIAENKN